MKNTYKKILQFFYKKKIITIYLRSTYFKKNKILTKKFLKPIINIMLPLFKINIEINIKIVNIKEIKKINFQYLNKNYPTNILSFYIKPIKQTKAPILSDIIICPKILLKEAIKEKKKIKFHTTHIIIHGILHILGYNHKKKKEKKKMQQKEIQLLKKLNYQNPYLKK